jgi:hypothetical protein
VAADTARWLLIGHGAVTQWQYARLELRATGTFGADQYVDWTRRFISTVASSSGHR